jgi:hypothetical protein
MIGQFGINRCPVLDNYGKKDCGDVLAVLGARNELVWLLGEPKENELSFTSWMYGRLRSPTYR